MPLDLDSNDAGRDWIKAGQIDLHDSGVIDGTGLSEGTFRRWLRNAGIEPRSLRALPIYSAANRARYPWLTDVVEGDDS